jgi:DNA polymerase III delta prime subunit
MKLPFSEKYKPRFRDLILDPILECKFKNIVETKTIENLIITGKSGIGKTCAIHAIAREIYPKNNIDQILELNASDDRGIKTVYDTIINFCKTCVDFSEGYCQSKMIILDEADNLTLKSQKLISSIIDSYPNVKFIFICNLMSCITESLNTRCTILNFVSLPKNLVIDRLINVCNKENIIFNEDALNYLYDINNNNLRQTLNILELVHQTNNDITIESINDICDIPTIEQFENLTISINTKNIKNLCLIIKQFQNYGYYSIDILLHYIQFLKNKNDLNKMIILESLSISSYTLSSNTTNYLQLTSAFLNCIDKI